MIKKVLLSIFLFSVLFHFVGQFSHAHAQATAPAANPYAVTPPLCGCPPDLNKIYEAKGTGEKCVTDVAAFQASPTTNHLWVEDQDVTAQGKANDRARQFIYWVMTHSAIDNHPSLFRIWGTTRNLAYFFTILSAALFGLAIIVGQRTNFATGVKIWPSITKIMLGMLYISFSATVVVTIVQLSGIFMKFFIENLGGADLFNIYFSGVSQEANYVNFVGCRDLNIRVQEAVQTEMWILKATNFSYYLMGGALLLRTIILWFLLFASPFVAILMFFGIVKNVGWVWVGTFFQWVFYGPLLALFLGSMATIWKNGIPFLFDFSRVDTAAGYVYPTAINILYGGPAQKLSASNNGNYVDTFVEYIITLIMLWAVTVFPWFLLRTFRDYCCDGINAIKNMMLSSLNNFKPGPTPPSPVAPTQSQTFGTALDMKSSRENTTEIHRKIETIEEIKRARTDEIVQSLDLKATNITQIANFETNKNVKQNVTKNISYLKNPASAESGNDRLRYMNLRSELSTRAQKADPMARQVINSFMFSKPQQISQRQTIISSLPKAVPVTNIISVKVKLPQAKVESVSSSIFDYGATNKDLAAAISAKTSLSAEKVQEVLSLLSQNSKEPPGKVTNKIMEQAKLEKEKVTQVIQEFSKTVTEDSKMTDEIAKKQNIDVAEVKKVVDVQMPIIANPEKNIDAVAPVSPLVSIDEYEQVKKMWIDHYEKGEIPIAENIMTRESWVEQDIVLITNTLNKLLSEDQSLKEQALDEVGFILPIFLVNSLSGEQLVTYLKAKVEAARQVQGLQLKEKEITEKLKAQSDQVQVLRPKKKEAAKTMTMTDEMEIK